MSFRIATILIIFLFISCENKTDRKHHATVTFEVVFFSLGAKILFSPGEDLRAIEAVKLFDFSDRNIAQVDFNGEAVPSEILYFRWKSGEKYNFRMQLSDGSHSTKTVVAPKLGKIHGSITIKFPFSEATKVTPLFPQDRSITGSLLIQHVPQGTLLDFPITFHGKLETSSGVSCSPKRFSGEFSSPAEIWQTPIKLEIFKKNPTLLAEVTFKDRNGKTSKASSKRELNSAPIEEIIEALSIEEVLMPTDSQGIFDRRRKANQLAIVRSQKFHRDSPIGFQSIRLRNSHAEPISLLVSSTIQNFEETSRTFLPVILPSGEARNVVLPLSFRSNLKPLPGRYDRLIELKIPGDDGSILREIRSFELIKTNFLALTITIITTLITGFSLIVFIFFSESIIRKFSAKELLTIAMFGTVIFVGVIVPSTLMANIISILFGPMAFLFTGLSNEVLYYILLSVLLRLVRKSGTIAFLSMVRFLLSGVLLGTLTPMALIVVGVSAILLELGFWITDRGNNPIMLALTFGICDAVGVFIDLQLGITFYRLFYANWYIFAIVLVSGFFYTFIGTILGLQLGLELSPVAR